MCGSTLPGYEVQDMLQGEATMTGTGTFSGSGYFYATSEATGLALFQGVGVLTGTHSPFLGVSYRQK